MKDFRLRVALLLIGSALLGCQSAPHDERPTFALKPAELNARLAHWQRAEPLLPERLVAIARSNLGQPYDIYLLGEAPFETIDPQPVYNLAQSDCVVFVEHSIAMALSPDFPSFLRMLQRIRYHDGEIGVRTRNHYTEVDWNTNNAWLAREITDELAPDRTARYKAVVDRKAFFKERYKLDVDVPTQPTTQSYIPYEAIPQIKSKLRTGDIVNFVKGTSDGSAWVHHMGLVAVMPDGAVHLIHSTSPRVMEEPIEAFIEDATKNNAAKDAAGKPRHRGFKFFRLTDDPKANLVRLDGSAAPRVTVPSESAIGFDEYVKQEMAR